MTLQSWPVRANSDLRSGDAGSTYLEKSRRRPEAFSAACLGSWAFRTCLILQRNPCFARSSRVFQKDLSAARLPSPWVEVAEMLARRKSLFFADLMSKHRLYLLDSDVFIAAKNAYTARAART